jgi:hypothetical protein
MQPMKRQPLKGSLQTFVVTPLGVILMQPMKRQPLKGLLQTFVVTPLEVLFIQPIKGLGYPN